MKNRMIVAALAMYIAALLAIALSGCTTAGKATRYFDAHRDTAAGYCASRYPVNTLDTTIRVTEDTEAYNAFVDNTLRYGDSLLRIAQERNDQVAAAQARVQQLQRQGEYTQAVADDLATQLAKIRPVDTAALRRSIEAQVRATLRPCRDTTIIRTVESTAKVAAAEAHSAKLQATADEYTNGRDSPATVFGWLFRALARKWWFWLIVVALVGYLSRSLWTPKIPFLNK